MVESINTEEFVVGVPGSCPLHINIVKMLLSTECGFEYRERFFLREI